MAGEVCARCLWTGPATSARDGACPVCGSPLPRVSAWQGPIASRAANVFAGFADANEGTASDAVDDPYMAELTSAADGDAGDAGDAGDPSGGRRAISRGRWALLAVNVGLLAIFVALVVSTALGWRPVVAGVANASSTSPTATGATSASVIPTTGSVALLPTPTATTTPTPSGAGGSGGVFAPTATPTKAPTVAPTPTPDPTVVSGGG